MTIYPELECLKNLFAFYDGELKYLLSRGYAKDEAIYLIKHFIECFAADPEIYRESIISYEKDQANRRVIEEKFNRQSFIQKHPLGKNCICSNLGCLVERKKE